jgi:hypothetical protein
MKTDTATTSKNESSQTLFDLFLVRTACAERVGVKVPTAATRSGSARTLTPTLTSARPSKD